MVQGGMKSNMSLSGGTACDLLMTDGGLDFRAAKDIDLASGITAACLKVCSLTSQASGLRIGKKNKVCGYLFYGRISKIRD